MDSAPQKSPPSLEREADFDVVLRSAQTAVPLHSSFQSEVWRRIATAQATTLSARIAQFVEAFLAGLGRPAVAAAAVLTMVTAGAWLGVRQTPSGVPGKLAYIESISPFAEPHDGGTR